MLIVNSGPRAWMYGLFFGAAAGAALVGLTASPFRLPRAGALSSLDRTDYGVAAIAPGQLARNLMMRGPLVRVLDVRPEHEFAVSRIPGSVHAEAGTSAEAVWAVVGAAACAATSTMPAINPTTPAHSRRPSKRATLTLAGRSGPSTGTCTLQPQTVSAMRSRPGRRKPGA